MAKTGCTMRHGLLPWLVLIVCAAPALGQEAVYRLNAGGSWYIDSASHIWEPDTSYRQYGYVGVTGVPISGTVDDKLYQSERYGASWEPEFAYHLPVTPGVYTVRLHFAEIYAGINAQNPRVFDVLLEGYLALDSYNIFGIEGYAAAMVEEFEVTVADTSLDIEFVRAQENPKISAIEVLTSAGSDTPQLTISPSQISFGSVRVGTAAEGSATLTNTGAQALEITWIGVDGANPQVFALQHAALPIGLAAGASETLGVTFSPTTPGPQSAVISVESNDPAGARTLVVSGSGALEPSTAVWRINAGGGAYTDADGNTWQSDAGLFNTGSVFTTAQPVWGTTKPVIYQTERYAGANGPDMTYSLPVAAGTYTVNLYFAEIYFASPGQRVFDVLIEGELVLNDFDVVEEAGAFTATVRSFQSAVSDGTLNIQFGRVVENPKVSAIEVLGAGGALTANPPSLNFGVVDVGGTSPVRTVTLSNNGLEPVAISSLEFSVLAGTAAGFTATLDGVAYNGGAADVSYPVDITLGAGASTGVAVTFAPTISSANNVSLRFNGAFGSVTVQLFGVGEAYSEDPYLHVVINKPAYMIDYDMDGYAGAFLRGDESYTSQPGRSIVAWQWSLGGVAYADTANAGYNFPVGDNIVTLTVWDNSNPPRSASGTAVMKIAAGNAAPGTLVQFYESDGADPETLLDWIPSPATYATKYSLMYINGGSQTIAPSPYSGNVMVQLLAQIDIGSQGTYQFQATGGSASRLFLNYAPVTGPVSLSPGRYALEARFAVPDTGYLPAFVQMSANGGPFTLIPAEITTHTQLGLRPVINEMPAQGNSSGGYEIILFGMVLAPLNDVIVHWGPVTLGNERLTVQGSSVRFVVPPGNGTIDVTLENSTGVSNVRTFRYTN